MADRNCESEKLEGGRRADKTVVIKERSREIFPRQRNDIYTVLPASVKTRSLLAGARESRLPRQCNRHEKCDLEERDARATRRAGMKGWKEEGGRRRRRRERCGAGHKSYRGGARDGV